MRTKALLLCASVFACATPYQRAGSDGYSDWLVGVGVHHIEVRGNFYTTSGALIDYFHRRAMEVCAGEGFSGFIAADRCTAEIRCSVPTGYAAAGMTFQSGTVFGDVVCMPRR